ncbi:aldehyde dehydrogenase, dimeric NADP-preferring-like isoform X2 [Oscarella lobularis]|uniref:aldehyde dehydrogenase, dimeric NADP-preferring-like isoform X2 n=1 Tax=Oscarella lobularis TaxID=121494 RepID=UPI003313D3E2
MIKLLALVASKINLLRNEILQIFSALQTGMSLEEQSQRVFGTVRAAFRSEKTLDIRFRKQQLLALERFLRDESQMLLDALHADLHKCTFEGDAAEIFLVQAEIAYHLNNIDSWVAPKAAGDKGVAFAFDTCLLHPQPLGVALIIGAWNYPIHLVLMPLVGAISAGCCAILKPSEVSSRSAAALQALDNYLDSECYRVVNGAADVATALLQQPFDHIFYTGGNEVGKIVMEAAAKHLTPVTLEMGGKSPCVVDGNSDLDVVARRILYGKFSNAGQICVSPDYVLCEKPVQSLLVDALQKAYKQFFKTDPKQSSDYCRIINRRHFDRVRKLIDPAKVKIGGEVDESELYIALTVMTDVGPDDPAMKEEIFGPVLPIVTVRDKEEAIEIINSSHLLTKSRGRPVRERS